MVNGFAIMFYLRCRRRKSEGVVGRGGQTRGGRRGWRGRWEARQVGRGDGFGRGEGAVDVMRWVWGWGGETGRMLGNVGGGEVGEL